MAVKFPLRHFRHLSASGWPAPDVATTIHVADAADTGEGRDAEYQSLETQFKINGNLVMYTPQWKIHHLDGIYQGKIGGYSSQLC